MPHRILVVDDHALNRLVLAEQLRTLGYASECAGTATEALHLFAAIRFDAVLVELMLQDADGFALAAKLRDHDHACGNAPVPVVGLSGHAAVDATLASQCGMVRCLARPMSTGALGDALRELLDAPVAAPPAPSRIESHWALFVRTSRDDLHDARAALAAGHATRVAERLHRIKGAALMIGEGAIAEACIAAELQVPEWNARAIASAIDGVMAHLEAADALRSTDAQAPPATSSA